MDPIGRFILKPIEWLLRPITPYVVYRIKCSCQEASFEGIRIANSDSTATAFTETMLAALKLIQETDRRRFDRIKRHIAWILNVWLWYRGAEYDSRTGTCSVDFRPLQVQTAVEWRLAFCASVLVHEATHGVLRARGIPYNPELRARIERLCVREESRFYTRLALARPELARQFEAPSFDVANWEPIWDAPAWQQLRQLFRRG